MKKNLVFILKATQDYIRYTEADITKNAPLLNNLFESISQIYIPLLNMLESFERDSLNVRFGLVLPPVLCTLLQKDSIHQLYLNWLDKRIELGRQQLNDENVKNNPELYNYVQKLIDVNSNTKVEFEEKYQKNLVKSFSEFQKKGYVEILATTGTDIFMLHYSDMSEVISAQVETGLLAYRNFFEDFPSGFWMPELGYAPGVEKIVRAYGFSYSVFDARSILLSKNPPSKGIFYPSRTENSLAVFTNDFDFDSVIFGEEGYSNNSVYRNEYRDLGFELEMDKLSEVYQTGNVRYTTGYKYWNKSVNSQNDLYNEKDAFTQIEKDATDFLTSKQKLLTEAETILSDSDYVLSLCALDLSKLKKNWYEGLSWLETVIRNAEKYDISIKSCNQMLEKQFSLEKITPCCSSSAGNGYGENLLSSKNCWMIRYIHKASERMTDLADRFPNDTGLKTRLLNLGAKELMIAQSSGLAKMIEENEYTDYAKERFIESITSFTAVFDSLGSNTVSTEWLTSLEMKDDLFPWMNYRIYSKKQ